MSDNSTSIAARIKSLLASRQPGAAVDGAPVITAAPMPGFRFGLGDPVLELVTGDRGVVRAAYYGAAAGGPVYEISIAGRGIVPRHENELEPTRALVPAPPATSRP